MADDPLAFDTTRCPIDPVTRISAEPILRDASVPDPPPDIVDCEGEPISPLPPEPPCPAIRAGTATFQYGLAVETPRLAVTVTEGECCDFDLGIELDVPCPAVGPASLVKEVNFGTEPTGTLTLTIGQSGCDFDLDLDLEVPCPRLAALAEDKPVPFAGSSTGLVTLTIDQVGCDFEFDIDIAAPCPTLTSLAEDKTIAYVGTINLSIVKTAECDYDFDIDLDFICPQLNSLVTEKTVAAAYPGTATLTVTPADNCDFNIDFDLDLPCPQLTSLAFDKTVTAGGDPVGTVTLSVTSAGNCNYDIDIDIDLTCPMLTSSAVDKPVVVVDGPGRVTLTIVPGVGCDYDFDIDLEIPCPTLLSLASSKPIERVPRASSESDSESEGHEPDTVTLTIERTDGCTYEFDVDVVLATPPCPTFAVATDVAVLGVGATPAIAAAVTLVDPENCHYVLTFALDLPRPGGLWAKVGPDGVPGISDLDEPGTAVLGIYTLNDDTPRKLVYSGIDYPVYNAGMFVGGNCFVVVDVVGDVLVLRPGSGGLVARTGPDGIDAAVDVDTPSFADVTVRHFNGVTFYDGPTIRAFNQAVGATGAVAGNRHIELKSVCGRWPFTDWEQCNIDP